MSFRQRIFLPFFAALPDLAQQLLAADVPAGVDLLLPLVAAAVLAPLHRLRPDQGRRRGTRGSRRTNPRARQVTNRNSIFDSETASENDNEILVFLRTRTKISGEPFKKARNAARRGPREPKGGKPRSHRIGRFGFHGENRINLFAPIPKSAHARRPIRAAFFLRNAIAALFLPLSAAAVSIL